MVCCVVQTCTRRSETSNRKKGGVSFHAFPKHPKLKREWTKFCRRAPSWQPKRTSVICSDHFVPSNFQTLASQRRLLENAIPTILLGDCEGLHINCTEANSTINDDSNKTPELNESEQSSQILHLESQTQQQQSLLLDPIHSSASESSAPDQLQNIQKIEADWKRKLESKNKQIKTLQDNNRYLKIRVNNLQTVCSRFKKLLTKKMAQEY